jgi:hypothetical protein
MITWYVVIEQKKSNTKEESSCELAKECEIVEDLTSSSPELQN